MTIDTTTLRLSNGQYLPQQHPKELIVLHFTAGFSCASAHRTWEANLDRIATAYGVDPDGKAYQFFPPEAWAYHLGVEATSRYDQRSIGIEIANVGPLKLDRTGEHLCYWPKDFTARFCGLNETHRYLKKSYRGVDYWAVMPELQQRAVGELVRHLCQRFDIPLQWTSAAELGEYCLPAMYGYRGIATHTNFRTDKWDVGPAFDWAHLWGPDAVAAAA
jgi:N-acetyl-anhydromuramyl-L-alanine amidase AmpD